MVGMMRSARMSDASWEIRAEVSLSMDLRALPLSLVGLAGSAAGGDTGGTATEGAGAFFAAIGAVAFTAAGAAATLALPRAGEGAPAFAAAARALRTGLAAAGVAFAGFVDAAGALAARGFAVFAGVGAAVG